MAAYKIYGKQHVKGTSKRTGNDYDFYNLHILCKERGVEGDACRVVMCDPSIIDYDKILIGQYYNFELGFSGGVVSITPAKP